jgi:hypothetical protein
MQEEDTSLMMMKTMTTTAMTKTATTTTMATATTWAITMMTTIVITTVCTTDIMEQTTLIAAFEPLPVEQFATDATIAWSGSCTVRDVARGYADPALITSRDDLCFGTISICGGRNDRSPPTPPRVSGCDGNVTEDVVEYDHAGRRSYSTEHHPGFSQWFTMQASRVDK